MRRSHFLILTIAAVGASCCGQKLNQQIPPWNGKVWRGDAPTGSIRRDQDPAAIACTDIQFQNYLCMSPGDFISFYNTFVLGCRAWAPVSGGKMMTAQDVVNQNLDAAKAIDEYTKPKEWDPDATSP